MKHIHELRNKKLIKEFDYIPNYLAKLNYKHSLKINALFKRKFAKRKTKKNEFDYLDKFKDKSKDEYKRRLKESALDERSIFRLSTDESIIKDKNKPLGRTVNERIKQINKKEGFTVYNTEENRQLVKILMTYLYNHRVATILRCIDNNRTREFTLSPNYTLDKHMKNIFDNVEIEEMVDSKYKYIINNIFNFEYIEFRFVNNEHYSGEFWKWINLSDVDLSDYGIFNCINKNNYKDSCFVYALIKSGILTSNQINNVRNTIQCRRFSSKDIYKISDLLKVNINVLRIDDNKKVRNVRCNKYDKTIKLILYQDHYMINKPVQVSKYYIRNYSKLGGKNKLIKDKDGRRSKKGLSIYKVICELFKAKLFKPINKCECNILSTFEYANNLDDYINLDYDEDNDCRLVSCENKKFTKWSRVYYADFETDSFDVHIPYLLVVVHEDNNKLYKQVWTEKFENFLDYLLDGSLCYFHNLKYDCCFLVHFKDWDIKVIERTGTILQIIMKKDNKTITFRNSYSLIPMALKKFGSCFELDVKKELMPYDLYRVGRIGKIRTYLFMIHLLQITKDITEINKIMEFDHDGYIDMYEYAEYYCLMDCIVLLKGMKQFNNDLSMIYKNNNKIFIGIDQFMSISAIGYDFARIYGCFNDCYEYTGKVQNFISRCINGGRTMLRDNQKLIVEGKIQDFDAVSLYPSAMSIMDGVAKGKCSVINKDLKYYDNYFVEIEINNIEGNYHFGLIPCLNNGIKIYGNKTNRLYIDKVGLEDLERYYKIDYKVIRGYGFNQGFNNKINEFIRNLFNLRIKYKQENNPLQSTVKLLLNSIYGKSILKPQITIKKIMNYNVDWINKNYNSILSIDVYNDKMYVKQIKPIHKHFNMPHFGVSVLSWSKHIMNKVICTAEQNDIDIFYQDTDSITLYEHDLDKLNKLFDYKLVGKSLCQFHCDFESTKLKGNIYSKKFIGLGKKSYLNILTDESGDIDYHVRMKGISFEAIDSYCKNKGITFEELYTNMYHGEIIKFDLGTSFRKSNVYSQSTLNHFYREVKF